jgi:hypothetical protein
MGNVSRVHFGMCPSQRDREAMSQVPQVPGSGRTMTHAGPVLPIPVVRVANRLTESCAANALALQR